MTVEAKAELRTTVTARRAGMSVAERCAADEMVRAAVLGLLPRGDAKPWCIAAYASLGREVDTEALLSELCVRYGAVALPVYAEDGSPALARCEDPETLVIGDHGVRMPPGPYVWVDPRDVDAIVVPGVAFDRAGARLGRGAGFYDRLLPRVRGERIGVAYDCQVVKGIPVDAHDAHVDFVVTEAHVYTARGWRVDSK